MELPVPNCPKVNCDDLLSETINNGFNQRIRQPMIHARFVYTNCFVQQTIKELSVNDTLGDTQGCIP